jgi:hypothetical protein
MVLHFIKKVGDPYTNLAVLPGGAGPVSVTNIHPSTQYQTGAPLACGAANVSYFGGYNIPQIETNFNGRTVPLTATATVIPGQTYHFKMVLADYQDANFDSAVFLEAGSFDIGVQLLDPAGVTLPSSINVCDNAPQTFTASVQGGGATYQWYLGTNPIPGATMLLIQLHSREYIQFRYFYLEIPVRERLPSLLWEELRLQFRMQHSLPVTRRECHF